MIALNALLLQTSHKNQLFSLKHVFIGSTTEDEMWPLVVSAEDGWAESQKKAPVTFLNEARLAQSVFLASGNQERSLVEKEQNVVVTAFATERAEFYFVSCFRSNFITHS